MKVIEQHKQDEHINLQDPIRLENWTKVAGRLCGKVYGHPKFSDGEEVTTSSVQVDSLSAGTDPEYPLSLGKTSMTSPRSWAARLRPLNRIEGDWQVKRSLTISEWHELADLLDLYADHLDSLASRGRLGGLKTASSMSVAERKARARKGGLASRKAKDPTPWCHQCGARKPESCKCGPIDPMN